jgi:ABC-2 type transport system permease protein
MKDLPNMIWIEGRKAIRSRLPLFTIIGSLFMPLGIAFLIFVSRNPDISRKLGLVSAKANLVAYSATDWPAYLGFSAQMIGAGGFILFVMIISWVFGREFSDGTVKDILAVPVQRSNILLAKFFVTAVWSVVVALVMFALSLIMGGLINLPQGSISLLLQGSGHMAITISLVIAVILPFGFFASVGRGYLLPIGVAILALIMANVVMIAGWGDYFPWAIPLLFAQGKSALPQASFWVVILTGLAGMFGTYLWWKFADQNR